MNDNEFFDQFPTSPRPEFVDSLRAKLVRMDLSKGAPIVETPYQSAPYTTLRQPPKPQRRSRAMSLVAACFLVLFLGTMIAINANQAETALPLAPMGTPVRPIIAKDNVSLLHPIAHIGQGRVYDALWSPDGKWLIMPGSIGLWVYDANDLSKPLYNIYPDVSVHTSLSFSGDGHYLIFVDDSKIYMWDLVEQRDIPPNRPAMPPTMAAALNHDGSVLAAASNSGQIVFYDTQANVQIAQLPLSLDTPITAMLFNPDGTQLAFLGPRTRLFVLSDPTGHWSSNETIAMPPKPFDINETATAQSFQYSPDGSRLAARVGTNVILWEADTGEEVTRFEIKPEVISMSDNGVVRATRGDLTFSPDGTQLLTVDEKVRLWELATNTSRVLLGEADGFHYTTIGGAHPNPDWTRLSLVMPDGLVWIHDLVKNERITSITDYTLGYIYQVAFSPDGQRLASVSGPQEPLLWNISDLANIPDPILLLEPYQSPNSGFGPQRVAFSPDNQFVATFRQNGTRNIQLWNRDGTSAKTWVVEPSVDDTSIERLSYTASLTYSTDGTRLLAMAPYNPLIRVWNTTTGKPSRTTFSAEEGETITFSTLSPDGQFVAIAMHPESDKDFDKVLIYKSSTGRLVTQIPGFDSEIRNLVYSPDGTQLAVYAINGTVYRWDFEVEGGPSPILYRWGSEPLAFSPDGGLIAGAEIKGKMLLIWDTATGDVLARLPINGTIQSLAFSPDGRCLAVGVENGTIQLWGLDPYRLDPMPEGTVNDTPRI